MATIELAARALVPVARVVARLAAPARPKLRDGLRGRRGLRQRLAALGAAAGGRIVWFHSASVGEYEQARPLAALLRRERPDLVPFHTFFSPSGYEFALRLGEAAHFDYLPEDAPSEVAFALEALRPRALVFLKFDLWPNLVFAARRRGVPLLLFDATLKPSSWRSRWPARALYAHVYRALDVLSAVSPADAARFRAIVPEHPAISVDGDTRFDQVVRRRAGAAKVGLAPDLLAQPRPFTLVAGSTWPPDEEIVLGAWTTLGPVSDGWRLVLVPHEPTPAHLEPIFAALARAALPAKRYSEVVASGLGEARCVVLDRVGILAELYAAGDAAHVGGAFGTGVHNLLEPASMGLPVSFGPRHDNAPEAGLLLDAGAASVVHSAADLADGLRLLGTDPSARRRRGDAARATVEAHLGAAERCWARLQPFLGDRPRAAVPSGAQHLENDR